MTVVPMVSHQMYLLTLVYHNLRKSQQVLRKKVEENSAEGGKSIRKSKDITPKVAEESGIEKSIGKLGDGEIESVAGRDAKAGARRAAEYVTVMMLAESSAANPDKAGALETPT